MCNYLVSRVWPTAGRQATQVSLALLSGQPVWSNNKVLWLEPFRPLESLGLVLFVLPSLFQWNHFIKMKDLRTQYARLGWFIQPSCGHRENSVPSGQLQRLNRFLWSFWFQCHLFFVFSKRSVQDIIMSAVGKRLVDSLICGHTCLRFPKFLLSKGLTGCWYL